jgi:hypothetical protein
MGKYCIAHKNIAVEKSRRPDGIGGDSSVVLVAMRSATLIASAARSYDKKAYSPCGSGMTIAAAASVTCAVGVVELLD